jgi:hypothetical protein
MNWAAEQHDLDPGQRRELYVWLESEEILGTSKDPMKEASRYAKELKKEAEMLKRSLKKSGAVSEKGSARGSRKKGKDDIEDLVEDFSLEGDGLSEGPAWTEEDVDREDYPDYYDSDY